MSTYWRDAEGLARALEPHDARLILTRIAVDAPDLVADTIMRMSGDGLIETPDYVVRFGVDVTDEH